MSNPSNTRDPPQIRLVNPNRTTRLANGVPDDVFTVQRTTGAGNLGTEPISHQRTNPPSTSPGAATATPRPAGHHRPPAHQSPGPTPLQFSTNPSAQHTPRRRAPQTASMAVISNTLTNHLQAARSRHAGKKIGSKMQQGMMVIEESDWNTLTSLIEQVVCLYGPSRITFT